MSKATLRARLGWKNGRIVCRKVKEMEVYVPSIIERRLLVELLAGELEGDPSVCIGGSGRDVALQRLVGRGMVARDRGGFVLTDAGRDLADRLADHMLGVPGQLDCA